MKFSHFLAIPLICALVAASAAQQPVQTGSRSPVFSHRRATVLPADLPPPPPDHSNYSEHVLLIRKRSVLDSAAAQHAWKLSTILQYAMQAGNTNRLKSNIGAMGFCTSSDIGDMLHLFATEGGGKGQPRNTAFVAWIQSIQDGKSGCLNSPPIRLLAIVNRADFGKAFDTPQGILIKKAELRFVFGALDSQGQPADILGIVEFVLGGMTPDNFRNYVQSWSDLRNLDDATFLSRLISLMDKSLKTAASARLRMEIATPGNIWSFSQFSFGDSKLTRVPLDREISPACRYSPDFKQTHPGLKTFVQANSSQIFAGDYSLDSGLLTFNGGLSALGPSNRALTLDQSVVAGSSAKLEQTRFILSVNSCTGCHTNETNTNFNHIVNSRAGQAAGLSSFLTGSELGKPSVGLFEVRPKTQCWDPNRPETYYYNDLLRRHWYMDAVLKTVPGQSDAAAWNARLGDFMTLEIH